MSSDLLFIIMTYDYLRMAGFGMLANFRNNLHFYVTAYNLTVFSSLYSYVIIILHIKKIYVIALA